jgi:predicted dehydrogenase
MAYQDRFLSSQQEFFVKKSFGAGANRRDFLKTSTALAATAALPYWFTTTSARAADSPNERKLLGCIGTGDRWKADGPAAMNHADCVALCDVDRAHLDEAAEITKKKMNERGFKGETTLHEDYREVLDNKDIDVVTIVTPDHWHTKIAIEAMKAGKDVYCEKPLTLTIDEGKLICKVARETKRVFQVGTQQRTEMDQRFLKAIAIVRDGRLGKVNKITCVINGVQPSGPIPVVDAPSTLNWEKWLGQAPVVDYRYKNTDNSRWGNSRCHYEFRWWYEYSGGKMTDWGAHHVDIAQWLIGQTGDGQGPTKVEPVMAEHAVPLDDKGMPTQDDAYNVANKFLVRCTFPNDVIVDIASEGRNGLLIEGTEGRMFVSRGDLEGKPVESLKDKPLPDNAIEEVYGGKKPTSHMANFFDCVQSRELPISDVFSHHRALTTCHLANIAVRLGRPIMWDAKTEQITGDELAQSMQKREQRKGYEIEA